MASSTVSPSSTSRSNQPSASKRKRVDPPPEDEIFRPKLQSISTDKSIVENLLECPICINLCIPPIHICNTGHHVCSSCRKSLKHCPTCKSAYGKGRNFFLENYFEQYCSFSCPFEGEGCGRANVPGKDLKDHQESCDFRPLECISCTRVTTDVAYSKYLAHLETIHRFRFQVCVEPEFVYSIGVKNLRWINSYTWKPRPFKFEDNIFFAMNEYKDNCFGSWIYMFGNKEAAKKYRSRISIVSPPNGNGESIYSMNWEGPVLPIRSMGERIMEEGKCLSTSKNFIVKIARLLEPNENLDHSYSSNYQLFVRRVLGPKRPSPGLPINLQNISYGGVDSSDSDEDEDDPIYSWTIKCTLVPSTDKAG